MVERFTGSTETNRRIGDPPHQTKTLERNELPRAFFIPLNTDELMHSASIAEIQKLKQEVGVLMDMQKEQGIERRVQAESCPLADKIRRDHG